MENECSRTENAEKCEERNSAILPELPLLPIFQMHMFRLQQKFQKFKKEESKVKFLHLILWNPV